MKKRTGILIGIMLGLCCGQVVLAQQKPVVNLREGLLACYSFTGNAQDASGNNAHGTVNGPKLTQDRFGNANAAYDFDGIDDHIDVTTNKLTNNVFTFSLWAKPTALPANESRFYLFSVGSISGDQSIELNNGLYGGKGWTFSSYSSKDNSLGGMLFPSGGVFLCKEGKMPVPLNEWVHLAAVRDRSKIRIYVNGKFANETDVTGSLAQYGFAQFRAAIGCRDRLTQFFEGAIDDIHIYNRALNDTEITALYNSNADAKLELTTTRTSICTNKSLTFKLSGAGTGAILEWNVDGIKQPLPKPNDKAFSYTFPEKDEDYVAKIGVEAKFNDLCFPVRPLKTQIEVAVRACHLNAVGIYFPDAFSPNGDGLNERWEIFGLDRYPSATVQIYARWGQLIFKSAHIRDFWDGTFDGKPLQDDVAHAVIWLNDDITLRKAIRVVK
ncbi:MAG: hypothetical protein EAZ32_13305 [Cytophagia bacterium]|nr:MAG: hypothetical protein EAZ38_14345 [Cytophagales bacterium]TAG38145.1 MAG: hypothetical protein EAZ32_13305 [Cytophagia bacterium]TAG79577.1 MAG: hypothetical protein EAZ22_11300 [Cytophagales bacterium]